jgi:uncharacterized DUF497 family protein
MSVIFEWDEAKALANEAKHGVSFELAQHAFLDPKHLLAEDLEHSGQEKRYFCFGMVEGNVMTVRFTWRDGRIRIFGAGYWRKGRKAYEEANR